MRKMRPKVLSLTLALLLLSQCITGYASQQMNSFQKIRTYSPGIFNDIAPSDWFYSEVSNSYCYGITNGTDESKFSPYGLVSIAEALTFAVRVNCIYNSKSAPTPVSGQEWYMANVDYAVKNGIIKEDSFKNEYDKPATRSEMGYIFAKSLPFMEFENINIKIESIPDMKYDTLYYNEIIMLYRAGVITGNDEYGTFSPTANITRAEASAILNRIIDPTQRKTFVPASVPTAATPAPTPVKMDAVAISDNAGSGVFQIEIYDSSGEAVANGSGFFIEESGVAVTNYHVIEDASSAKAVTLDGNKYDISVVYGYDKTKDVAIIQVDGNGFTALKLGDSDKVQTGQRIFCVGSPLGLKNTISEGVVSNAKRTIEDMTFIQISAPISPGSSGGAVLNEQCEVIGISTAAFTNGQNLNLAVPSNVIPTITRGAGITLEKLFAPQPTQTPTPTPVTAQPSAYYKENNAVRDYTSVTGTPYLKRDINDKQIVSYTYSFNSDDFIAYAKALVADGYTLYKTETGTDYLDSYFVNGNQMVLISANARLNVIFVIFSASDNNNQNSGTNKTSYYPEVPEAPNYGTVTGARLLEKEARDTGGYMYVYSLDQDQVLKYIDLLYDEGFTLYDKTQNNQYGYLMYTYVKDNTIICVFISVGTNEVIIMPSQL